MLKDFKAKEIVRINAGNTLKQNYVQLGLKCEEMKNVVDDNELPVLNTWRNSVD